MRPSDVVDAPIFLLGLQRSGTTWFANIFDSSPDTLLLFEPFAPKYKLFEQFPHEYLYIAPPSPFLNDLLRTELPTLVNRKSFLFNRPDVGYIPFRMERFLMRLLLRLNSVLRSSRLDYVSQYQLLNLNRMGKDSLFFPKNEEMKRYVIKELRLNFKIDLLANIYPKAKFLFIVRHPAAVVSSVLSWFRRGRLSELRRNLDIFLECMAGQVIFQPYLNKIEYCRGKDIHYKLALYWLISTEIVLKQFEGAIDARVIIYEQLASNPTGVTQQLFEFVGLEFGDQVRQYVFDSSTVSPASLGVIDTVRQSDSYYRKWQEQLPHAIRKDVLAITADSHLLPEIEEFY